METRKPSPPEGSYDYFIALGMEPDEARSLVKSWGFTPPDIIRDGEKAYRDYLLEGSEAERQRRDETTDSASWVKELKKND